MATPNVPPEDDEDPDAWADELEDAGALDSLPVDRRKFLALAHGFGGAAALSALSGCTGGDGGDGGGSTPTATAEPTATPTPGDTPAETQRQKQTPAGEPEVVKVSTVPVNGTIPFYVAKEEGYFAERNIEVQLSKTVSGSKATAQMATGQLEGTAGATGASTMNAILKGVGIKAVADRTRFIPDRQSTLDFIARKEVYEEGFDLSDAEGLTWATNTTGSVGHHHVARALKAHGLTFDDITFETLPFPQMVSALSSGAIDIAQEVGALVAVAKGKAGAKHVEWTVQTTPNSQVAFLQFGEPFINQRPETARKTLEAYILGIRKMYEYGIYSDRMVDIWTKYTDNPKAALLGGIPPWASMNGALIGDSLVRQQEFWQCQDFQDEVIPKSDLVANDLREEAIDNIGTADPEFVPLETWKEWQEKAKANFPPRGEFNEPGPECGGGLRKQG